jgi:alpha-tubulin suppressor-like RCC1 family protein
MKNRSPSVSTIHRHSRAPLAFTVLTALSLLFAATRVKGQTVTVDAGEFQRLVYGAHLHTQLALRPELEAGLQVMLDLHQRNPAADPVALAGVVTNALLQYRNQAPYYLRTNGARDEVLGAFLDTLRQLPARTNFTPAHLTQLNSFMLQPHDYTNGSPAELIHSANQRLLASESEAVKRQALVTACVARAQRNPGFAATMDNLLRPETGVALADSPAVIMGNTNSPLHGNPSMQILLGLSQASGNGSVTVSNDLVMTLFSSEMQTVWDTIHTNLAVLAQINQRQPDLLSYLTNQAAINANVQLWTTVQQGQSARLASATAVSLVHSELLPVDTESAQVQQAIGAVASFGGGLLSLCLGHPGGLGSLFSGGMGIFNVFSGGNPAQDAVADQLSNIQTLLGDLSENTNYRFDRVDESLTTIFETMHQQFNLVTNYFDGQGRRIAELQGDVNAIRSSLVDIHGDLDRLERHLLAYVNQLYGRDLNEDFNHYLGYEATYGSPMSYLDYADTENHFFTHARNNAVDGLSSPYLDRDYTPFGLLAELTEAGGGTTNRLDQNLNYLKKYLADVLGQPTEGALGQIANPRDWFVGAYAYAQLALENPRYYRQVNPATRLDLISARGRDLTNFIGSLAFKSGNINWPLHTALENHYVTNLIPFNAQISALEANYASNHGFAVGTWRQWDASAPRVTATSTTPRASDPNVPLVGLPNPASSLAGGFAHSLAVRTNGTVIGWGDNSYGQVTVPAAATNVVALAAGRGHTLALKANGTVTGWGDNSFGQTSIPGGLSNVVAIAAGDRHSLALETAGTVVGWGANSYGQTNKPVGLSNVVAVAAGVAHSLALKSDGTVTGWGLKVDGATDFPAGLTGVVAIAAGAEHSLALKSDGTVVGAGAGGAAVPGHALAFNGSNATVTVAHQAALNAYPLTVSAWINTTQVNGTHTGVLNKYSAGSLNGYQVFLYNGNLRAWYFQGPVSGGYRGVFDGDAGLNGGFVADGRWHHVALVVDASGGRLFVDGTLKASRAWTGAPGAPTTTQPLNFGTYPPLTNSYIGHLDEVRIWNVARSQADLQADMGHGLTGSEPGLLGYWRLNEGAGGSATNLAVTTGSACDGVLSGPTWITGWGEWGQSTIPSGLSNVVAISAGNYHSVALKADGTVVCWGQNDQGQCNVPGGLNDVRTVIAGAYHNLAIKANGTIVSWGAAGSGQRIIPNILGWQRAISWAENAGEQYVSLTTNGTTCEWGYSYPHVPLGTSNLESVVFNGGSRTLAIRADGTLWRDSYVPVPPASAINLVDIASGYDNYLALKKDGTVVPWGDNSHGELNVPAGLNDVVAISAGLYYSLALKRNGTVAGWGYNWSGQVTIPPGLANVVAISASYMGTCLALKADGTLTAWGRNSSGEANIPAGLSNVVAISADACLAIRADGTLVGWGPSATVVPPEATNVVAVAGNLAVRGDGTVVGWFYGHDCDWKRGQSDLSALDFPMPVDSSTNRYTGVRLGATPVPVDPPLPGYALSFDGLDDSFVTPDLTAQFYPRTATVTLELWFLARGPGIVVNEGLYGGYYRQSVVELLTTPTNSAVGEVRISLNVSGTASNLRLGTVPYGTWNHVALRYNATNYVLDGFLNGIPGPTATAVRAWGDYAMGYSIGGWNDRNLGSRARFNGMVDEFRIWNVVRSQADIQANMSHPLSGTEPGLAACWHFDEGPFTTPKQVKQFSAGHRHSLALLNDGTVAGFGVNDFGQSSPPAGLTNVIAVAAGGYHSLALRADGTVVGWGYNGYGQASVPAGLQNVVAIAAGFYHNLAIRADGSVVAWGDSAGNTTTVPPLLNNVVAVAAGGVEEWRGGYSLALQANGTVVEWGNGSLAVPAGLDHVVAIAAGSRHRLALRDSGEVVAWDLSGSPWGETNVPPAARSGVVAIAAGRVHSLALKRDGSVVTWGGQAVDRFTVPPGISNVVALSAGGYHSLFLTASDAQYPDPGERYRFVRAQIPARVPVLIQNCNANTLTELGLTGTSLAGAATRLSGTKALLSAVLELEMPYTLADDEVLRGFLYGSESLADSRAAINFLQHQNAKLEAAPDTPPEALTEVAALRFLRFQDRLHLCLTNLQATGQPEYPRLVGHTLRLLNLLRDAWTQPTNSPPPAVEIWAESRSPRLVLHGEPYQHYTLQYRDNLRMPGWSTSTADWRSGQIVSPPTPASNRFYRATLPLP